MLVLNIIAIPKCAERVLQSTSLSVMIAFKGGTDNNLKVTKKYIYRNFRKLQNDAE